MAVLAAIIGAGWLYLFTGHGRFAGPPATCRDVAERLQARGMNVRWHQAPRFKYPAILVADNDDPDSYTYGFSATVNRFKEFQDAEAKGVSMEELVKKGLATKNDPLPAIADLGHMEVSYAVIVQYPTDAEAREKAGTMKNGFASGRFVIFGDAKLVNAIKSRL